MSYRTPQLQRVKESHVKVVWWDTDTDRQRSRWISTSKSYCEQRALHPLKQNSIAPEDYRVNFTISETFKNLKRIKFYYRIPAEMTTYFTLDVPLDAYILAS